MNTVTTTNTRHYGFLTCAIVHCSFQVKAKKVNLFERKVPDKRFYKPHRMRQTPNEMNRYKKMRNRTFFKPLEQAIHEKDFIDHEVKYQPERQLLMVRHRHRSILCVTSFKRAVPGRGGTDTNFTSPRADHQPLWPRRLGRAKA